MKSRIIEASYERAMRLMEAGCPIDNPEALPRHSFRVEKLPGYMRSCVYALGPRDTRWVIALRLVTDRASGTIIRDWKLDPPWPDHHIEWDYEPEDVIPRKDQDVYKRFLRSRLVGVLNEGRKIHSGSPVDGVLCGCSFQPIGESSHGFISTKLSFTDDRGTTVRLCIDLNIDTHRYSSARQHVDSGRRFGLSAFLAGLDSEPESLLNDTVTHQGDGPGRETGGDSAGVTQDG